MIEFKIENFKSYDPNLTIEKVCGWLGAIADSGDFSDEWMGDNEFDMNVWDAWAGSVSESFYYGGTVYRCVETEEGYTTDTTDVLGEFDLRIFEDGIELRGYEEEEN